MYSNVQDFLTQFAHESAATTKLLAAVSDAHFNDEPNAHVRSTGRLSWHIAKAVSEIGGLLPVSLTKVGDSDKPLNAAAAAALHSKSAAEVLAAVKSTITNDMLGNEINAWGMTWTVSSILWMIVAHEIHHRGQLQIVMRVVGDVPVGVVGPTDEEMQAMMAAQKG